MPRGPQGQKRPADTIAAAIMLAKIATGEIEEKLKEPSGKVRSGKAGAKARAGEDDSGATLSRGEEGRREKLGVMRKGADRTKQVAHYIISRTDPAKLGATKLNKAMWVADLRAYRELGTTITGQLSYRKLQNGPVPNGIVSKLDLLIAEQNIARRYVDTSVGTRHEYVWITEPDVSKFSAREIDILNRAIDWVCENHTAASISSVTHDALWEETIMGDQISIAAASIEAKSPSPRQIEWARKQIESLV